MAKKMFRARTRVESSIVKWQVRNYVESTSDLEELFHANVFV